MEPRPWQAGTSLQSWENEPELDGKEIIKSIGDNYQTIKSFFPEHLESTRRWKRDLILIDFIFVT